MNEEKGAMDRSYVVFIPLQVLVQTVSSTFSGTAKSSSIGRGASLH